MFKLVQEPVSVWPVVWNGVSPEGRIVEQSLTLKLARIGRAEFGRLFPADGTAPPLGDREMFDRLVRGWDGVLDAEGQPLAMTADNIDRLLDVPGFAAAFGNSYVHFWAAIEVEREKNSAPPSDGATAAPAADAATTSAPN